MTQDATLRPVSLRVSVTDRCSLRCTYCMPEAGAPVAFPWDVLSDEEIVAVVCAVAASHGLEQVRLTGGEPLLRPELDRLVGLLAAAGVPDLALTTNGQWLAGMADRLKHTGLTRVNVSLDSLDPRVFSDITRGGILAHTLAGIAAAQQAGLTPIKLNMVVMRGQNDGEVTDLVRFAIEHDCQMRFLELMPIGPAAGGFEQFFVSTSEVRERLQEAYTLVAMAVDPAGTSRDFVAEGRDGRSAIVGFISPYSEPFCGGCRRLRLTASGVLIGCLAREGGIPLAPLLRRRGPSRGHPALAVAVERALDMKRRNREFIQPRAMVGIGG